MNVYLSLLTFAVGIHEFVRYSFPETYNNVSIQIAYNAIYLYSHIQIVTNHAYNYMFPQGFSLIQNIFPNLEVKCIEFIKNGHVIHKCTKNMAENFHTLNSSNYDFILHHIREYNIIYKTLPETFNVDFVRCKQVFLLCELTLENDSTYELKLTNNGNYMVKNNIIDQAVIKYIFNKSHKTFYETGLDTLDSYTLCIMDNNININKLSHKDSIHLHESSYTIHYHELPLEPSLISETESTDGVNSLINVVSNEVTPFVDPIENIEYHLQLDDAPLKKQKQLRKRAKRSTVS